MARAYALPMSCPCLGSQFRIRITFGLLLLIPGPEIQGKTYRNFNLPCLAPLLTEFDSENPTAVNLAFLRGPWRAPIRRDDVGMVHFPITTVSPEAQHWFNQGIAFLHGQANEEAERSFRQALLLDPANPMTFWGLAMANEQRPGRSVLFAQAALRRINNTTSPREVLWIRALTNFHDLDRNRPTESRGRTEAGRGERSKRYQRRIHDLEQLALSHPDDIEAKAFLLRQLVFDLHRSGIALTSHLAVDHLAGEIARLAPGHPSAHYRVFLWLQENPGQSLTHARSSPGVAPGLAHSWRFAAEGWRLAGKPHEAITLLQYALQVHHREMHRNLLMPDAVGSLPVDAATLGEALISMGRLREARALADTLLSLPRSLSGRGLTTKSSELLLLGRRLYAQAGMQAGEMEAVSRFFHPDTRFSPSPHSPREVAQVQYWKGLALCSLSRPAEARPLLQALRHAARTRADDPFITKRNRGLCYFQTLCAGEDPGEILSPPHLPARIHARAWQGLDRKGAPEEIARSQLAQAPRGLFATALFCSTTFEAGNRFAVARAFDRTFRENVLRADRELQDFPSLDKVAAALSLPKRWSLPPGNLEPTGAPPETDDLEPSFWSPPAAPGWRLPNHTGRQVSLSDFEGQAVLIHFFLGVHCPFCLRQLETFRHSLAGYHEAGIEMVAISSDPVEALTRRLGTSEEKTAEARETFPFPVLADPGLKTFRDYHVFDDFEGGPMHGTFLVGPTGGILWSDSSHEPFTNARDLLAESARLLQGHELNLKSRAPRDPQLR